MFFHVELLKDSGATLPTRGVDPRSGGVVDDQAVGYDLYAASDGFIEPLTRRLIGLGFKASFTPGHVGRYADRSGMANKGITFFGGVIDPSYRGEWKVILYNSTGELFEYKKGDRIVQVIFVRVELPEVSQVSSVEDSLRGASGIGSSGK